MTKKEELYYLLKAYKRGEYDIKTFCDVFEGIFYPDIPRNELSQYELEKFERLAEIVVRFSAYQEDHILYPKVYRTEAEVNAAIELAYIELVKN